MLISACVGILFVVVGLYKHSDAYSLFGLGLICAYSLVSDAVSLIVRLPLRKD